MYCSTHKRHYIEFCASCSPERGKPKKVKIEKGHRPAYYGERVRYHGRVSIRGRRFLNKKKEERQDRGVER